jgi:hypothetical protein
VCVCVCVGVGTSQIYQSPEVFSVIYLLIVMNGVVFAFIYTTHTVKVTCMAHRSLTETDCFCRCKTAKSIRRHVHAWRSRLSNEGTNCFSPERCGCQIEIFSARTPARRRNDGSVLSRCRPALQLKVTSTFK